jgi:hypothetical protein
MKNLLDILEGEIEGRGLPCYGRAQIRGKLPAMSFWHVFQFSVCIAFMCANIFFKWGIEGIASPVMGGMLSWYLTGILSHLFRRRSI